MAMNKAEKAAFEALECELAFRWPTVAEPEPLNAPKNNEQTEGWGFNTHTMAIDRRWSTSVSNGRFYEGRRSSGTQGGIRLYRTEADAYIAMRWQMCREMAAKLHNVDKRLARTGNPA